MEAFTKHSGIVAALDRVNVDTDQIIPKQFLKRIERTGFGEFLFFDWRFMDDGSLNPEFELNKEELKRASILLTGANFGCGSSREHAPWALRDYGFQVLLAPSFADIFYNNCFKNGILPIRLPQEQISTLFEKTGQHTAYELKVDLASQTIMDSTGLEINFEIDPFRKRTLMEGLDDIALTLQHEEAILKYETAHSK